MKVKRLQHVAIATRDMAEFVGLLQETFGISPPSTQRLPGDLRKTLFRFEDGSHLEVIEPGPDARGLTSSWLEQNGESLFHFALEVEDIESAMAELKSRGVALLDQAPRSGSNGTMIAFVDPAATRNILIELIAQET